MLFTADAWPGIADGTITVTFRTWSRPQAKTGGRYRIAGMLIEATSVEQVAVAGITEADAQAAGAADRAALIARLGAADEALVWRVRFRLVGADDRIERRTHEPTDDELQLLRVRLERLDRRSGSGPWTGRTLRLIDTYPGIVSTVLAKHAGQDRAAFKLDVRKLKELGLTESLVTGYQLSPLGRLVLHGR